MKRMVFALILLLSLPLVGNAEQCVTQSQMKPAERVALSNTALALVQRMQANDVDAVKAQTLPQYAQDFTGMAQTIATTAPQLQGASFQPSTLWILDATPAAGNAGSAPQDAQFFCNLNKTRAETTFVIPALPPGRYGLAVMDAVRGNAPWQIALLMKQTTASGWQLAGLFPRPVTAAGHDGVWYWTSARAAAAKKQSWSAWIDYVQAEQLLRPVNFVASTHLDQLREEQSKAAPAALSAGIGPETPLVIKAKDGTEYRVTGLGPDASLGGDRIDVAMHFRAEPVADPVAARARNQKAASALLAAYPELRENFHGVWVFTESQTGTPFASEEPMARLQ